jgi:hypothetical protein
MKGVKNQLRKIIREEISKLYKKNLINEHDFDDFTERSSYIDSQGSLVGQHSDNQIAAAKLAYDELKEMGVPVAENLWWSNDPTILFIINAENDSKGKWVNPFPGSEKANMEGWKNQTMSNFVYDILKKYNLYGEWADSATLQIRAI